MVKEVDKRASGQRVVLPKKIVVVGANVAGINAASAVRKTDRKAEITLVEKGKEPAYSRCGLPFVLSGEIPRFEDLILFPPSFYKMMKIDLQTETTVKTVDPKKKTIQVEMKDGTKENMEYDSLVLAIGAHPFVPPIKGWNCPGVFPLRTIDDGEIIQKALETAKSAVVIGAGFIGLEAAHAFVNKEINVTVVEIFSQVLPAMLDKDMADIFQKEMEKHGVRVILSKGVDEILCEDNRWVRGVLVAGEKINADLVVLGMGVRHTTDLASQMGAEIGKTGGIKVDQRMMTNIQDVYAAGDCVESYSLIDGQPCVCQLGTTAVRQGKVAGVNAAGGYAVFPGVLGSTVSRMFETEIGATGLTEFSAKRAGLKTVSGSLAAKTKTKYFPNAKDIKVKIIVDQELGRVLGGQIVAEEDVAQRINMISIAVQKQTTAWELADADTCYAPPVADTWEPVALAAEVASKRIRLT